jgi:hypothetical protein
MPQFWNAQINFYWFIERRDLLTSLTTAPPNNDPQDSHSEHACDNPNCAYIHTTHIFPPMNGDELGLRRSQPCDELQSCSRFFLTAEL